MKTKIIFYFLISLISLLPVHAQDMILVDSITGPLAPLISADTLDLSPRGIFIGTPIDLSLKAHFGYGDFPLIILGDASKYLVMRYKKHVYLFSFAYPSQVSSNYKQTANSQDSSQVFFDLIDSGKVDIMYIDPNSQGPVQEIIDTFLEIKEGSIRFTYYQGGSHHGLFEIEIKRLVLK